MSLLPFYDLVQFTADNFQSFINVDAIFTLHEIYYFLEEIFHVDYSNLDELI
jgi:hypothetical protein